MKKKAFIPVSALIGVLLLTLVATMTLFIAEPDIAYAQAPLANADLNNLEVAGSPDDANEENLLPSSGDGAFAAATTMYTVRIPFNDSGVDITATEDTADQTIKVNGTTVTSGTAHTVTGIASGTITTINIEVTAPAGNKKVYTVKVYRERSPKSDNANLRSLGLAGVTLSPAFSSGTTSYKARVQASKVTVSYSLSDTAGGASAAISAPSTGVTGMEVTLAAAADEDVAEGGITTITVMVTPESVDVANGNACATAGIKCYMIEVYRIRANESDNADLSGLILTSVGGAPVGSAFSLNAAVTDYTHRMNNATTHVTVDATVADAGASLVISPSDADSNTEDHQVSLTAGAERTITVTVTAEDPEAKKTYTVKVYRNRNTLSEEAELSSLSLSTGTLDPAFRRATLQYDVRVGPDVEDVTVSYATVDTAGAASVDVTAVAVDERDGADAGPITLLPASPNEIPLQVAGMATRIKVTVTPEAGPTNTAINEDITKEYIITIYRVRTAPSADATLSGLMLGTAPLADFNAAIKMYNHTVENATSSIAVDATATRADRGATVDIAPASPVDLTAGMTTTITITVTAEDGVLTDEYTVNVYRNRADESDDATLSALSLSDGTLSPAFLSDRMEYTARVGNDVDKITVSYRPTDNAGGVTVNVSSGATADDPTGGCADDAGDEVDLLTAGSNTIISLCVTPEAGADPVTNLEVYQITVYRMRSNPSPDTDLETFEIMDASSAPDATKFGTETVAMGALTLRDGGAPDVGYRVRSVTVNVDADVGAVVEIMPEDSTNGMMGHQIVLAAGEETMISVTVTPEDSAADPRTYTANVYRQNVNLSDDATLSSLILSGVTLMYKDDNDMDMTGFMSDVMDYTGDAGSEKTTVTAMASHLGAQSGITVFYGPDGDEAMLGDDGGYEITVGEVDDDISITVQVKPESVDEGTETGELGDNNNCIVTDPAAPHGDIECYTITVTRAEEGATLLSMYDADGDGDIDLSEVSAAIDDYFNDDLTLAEVSAVIDLYFQ